MVWQFAVCYFSSIYYQPCLVYFWCQLVKKSLIGVDVLCNNILIVITIFFNYYRVAFILLSMSGYMATFGPLYWCVDLLLLLSVLRTVFIIHRDMNQSALYTNSHALTSVFVLLHTHRNYFLYNDKRHWLCIAIIGSNSLYLKFSMEQKRSSPVRQ